MSHKSRDDLGVLADNKCIKVPNGNPHGEKASS